MYKLILVSRKVNLNFSYFFL